MVARSRICKSSGSVTAATVQAITGTSHPMASNMMRCCRESTQESTRQAKTRDNRKMPGSLLKEIGVREVTEVEQVEKAFCASDIAM